jgi:SAM-dependent MidA family methyltransferase
MSAESEISQLIHREGPITFDRFMEAALYGEGGFFASGRGAGRSRRDFITSPEVGSLFGACVARALDGWWRALDGPDPFLVVEAGAGTGRLARDIMRAEPECLRALRYVLVERSDALRAEQRSRLPIEPADEALGPFARRSGEDAPVPTPGAGPVFAALDDMPAVRVDGVVIIANELLDNLPFGIAERTPRGWSEIRVGHTDDEFTELLVPIEEFAFDAPVGTRVPIPIGIGDWLRACDDIVHRGFVVVIDYMVDAADLPHREWLRTYREHGRGSSPTVDPGMQDITADVVREQLFGAAPFALANDRTQADWLRALEIDALVDDGRRAWREGAATGGLDALAGRSRVNEAAALTDPNGLGAHRVVEFARLDSGT